MNTHIKECGSDGGGGRVHLEVQTKGENYFAEIYSYICLRYGLHFIAELKFLYNVTSKRNQIPRMRENV
jgi:hypothetical protein